MQSILLCAFVPLWQKTFAAKLRKNIRIYINILVSGILIFFLP
jgi:hypothetical protein